MAFTPSNKPLFSNILMMPELTETKSNAKPIAAVDLENVQFKYRHSHSPIVDIEKWQLPLGDTTFIHGPSGSGKSTLLNLLAGLLVPTQGSVKVMGEEISQFHGSRRDRFRAQHIGVIFQQFNLIPWLSVQDNITAAYYFSAKKDLKKSELAKQIANLLDRLGLSTSLIDRKTEALSIGQQQRVAIARALINQPELIIADEPTSALDTEARVEFMHLLMNSISEYSSTLIFVSHDRSLAKNFNNIVDLKDLNLAVKAGMDVK